MTTEDFYVFCFVMILPVIAGVLWYKWTQR